MRIIQKKLISLKYFSLVGFIASSFSVHSLPEKIIAQNNNLEAQQKSKIDPTAEVAGGVGEEKRPAPRFAVLPTGKTLPKGIFKVEMPVAYSFGTMGFDSEGKKVNNGLDYKRLITGALIQYGLTNSISIGIGLPFVNVHNLGMDGNTVAANSEMYKHYYDHLVNKLATAFSSSGGGALCGGNTNFNACLDYINNQNGSTGVNQSIVLPTGETVTLTGTASIKSQVRNILLTASQPTSGATGIGDIQVGILWSVISEQSPLMQVPLYLSVGGGMRFPTGKFNLASAMRPTGGDNTLITGGGTYDLIVRWNLDYVPAPGFIFSWQHASEYSLNEVELGRTSMIDNTTFNTADPTVTDGDKQLNTLKFSRKGLHHVGFVQAAWGVGNISESYKWLGFYTQAKYNIAAKAFLNNMPIYTFGDQFYLSDSSMHPDHGVEQYYSASIGTKVSGLPYRIPVDFSAEFEYPFAGKNRMISPMNMKGTLGIYF
ncbi:MAG: hypothetical protein DCC88_05015 [Spirobacillus cienkowskii]|jgi:hypothetical protein|uniref:Uncharacterized protein n=1 Tax=Spirobacillus cienkowskii TaxID=495820 RepID=A0A369KXN5_9BACT|nr:MAG: hypothetical protein DCC88_05015 [Spirobacillus cienkowskii]